MEKKIEQATVEEMIEKSKLQPKRVFEREDGAVVFGGIFYSKEQWRTFVLAVENPMAFRTVIKVLNFFRWITFRKPLD